MSGTVIAERLDWTKSMSGVMSRRNLPKSREVGARRRADRPVEDRRARPAIPRSMSF
jgi:hypothetical protein